MLVLCLSVFLFSCATDKKQEYTDQEKLAIYRELGIRYLNLGMNDIAMQKLKLALKIDSENAKTQNAIAVAYERIEKAEQARRHFNKALALAPDDTDTLNNYGRFLCNQNDFQAAMPYLQRAVNSPINRARWQAFTNIGHCVLVQGHRDKAESYFKKALALQNNYAPALIELSKINYQQGNYMSARGFLERFAGASEGNYSAESLLLGFNIEHALGDENMAEKYRSLLIQKFPDSKEAKKLF